MAERAQAPGDDFISVLLQVRDGDLPALSQAEVTTILSATLSAGHETTTNLIGNSVDLLLRHPDALEDLRANPQHIATAVVTLPRGLNPV